MYIQRELRIANSNPRISASSSPIKSNVLYSRSALLHRVRNKRLKLLDVNVLLHLVQIIDVHDFAAELRTIVQMKYIHYYTIQHNTLIQYSFGYLTMHITVYSMYHIYSTLYKFNS